MSKQHRSFGRRSFLASALLAAGSAPAAADEVLFSRGRRPAVPRTLEVVTTEEAELHYWFAVEGTVEPTETSDTVRAEGGNDALVTGADPSMVVIRGFTGNPGYGDAYEIEGDVVSFVRTAGSSDFFVRLDGERVPIEDLNDGDGPFDPEPARELSRSVDGTFEVVSTERAELYYRFAVDGDVTPTETNDRVGASGNDAIIGGADPSTIVIRGFTGNPGYGDAYEIDGELRSFRRMGGSSDFYVRIDGERYDIDELADGGGSLDAEVACYHSAATVSADEYDSVRLRMKDSYGEDAADMSVVEFDDGYAGETTFGYAGDYAVTEDDVTFDEFRGAVEEVIVVRGDRSQTFSAMKNASGLPKDAGVVMRRLLDVEFNRSTVDPTIENLGPCQLAVEFADGAEKSYYHDMGSETFGSPGRIATAVDFTLPAGTPNHFGVRVPNPDPADDPRTEPAVRFGCTAVTIEEREFVNQFLGTPRELEVTLTFADGSQQQRTIDGLSFPLTLGGTGAYDGEVLRRFHAEDRHGRTISAPNPSVEDCT